MAQPSAVCKPLCSPEEVYKAPDAWGDLRRQKLRRRSEVQMGRTRGPPQESSRGRLRPGRATASAASARPLRQLHQDVRSSAHRTLEGWSQRHRHAEPSVSGGTSVRQSCRVRTGRGVPRLCLQALHTPPAPSLLQGAAFRTCCGAGHVMRRPAPALGNAHVQSMHKVLKQPPRALQRHVSARSNGMPHRAPVCRPAWPSAGDGGSQEGRHFPTCL